MANYNSCAFRQRELEAIDDVYADTDAAARAARSSSSGSRFGQFLH
jgi:hypothetical protein